MNESSNTTLSPRSILEFLFFRRDAILKVASSRSAFWIGLLFVVAAGFAREYDGEYLVAEPWHLILPLAASLIGCGFMVILIFVLLRCNGEKDCSFAEVFRSFLNVYWMTAPLALVYGIPVERFFDPGDATRANLVLLAIVAVWRVLLMIRCVYVLCSTSIWRAIVVVLLFSDILAMLALYYVPGPIFMIMGGVRLTESEDIILAVRMLLMLLCYGSLLIWLFGYIRSISHKQALRFYRTREILDQQDPKATKSLWLLGMASILFWLPWLSITQPEQKLRWQSEQFIEQGKFVEFGQLTSSNDESKFPPHWDPPPRAGYGDTTPKAFKVLHGLLDGDAAPWVIEKYTEKLDVFHNRWMWGRNNVITMPIADLRQFVSVLEQIDDGKVVAKGICGSMGWEDALKDVEDEQRMKLLKRIEVVSKPKPRKPGVRPLSEPSTQQ